MCIKLFPHPSNSLPWNILWLSSPWGLRIKRREEGWASGQGAVPFNLDRSSQRNSSFSQWKPGLPVLWQVQWGGKEAKRHSEIGLEWLRPEYRTGQRSLHLKGQQYSRVRSSLNKVRLKPREFQWSWDALDSNKIISLLFSLLPESSHLAHQIAALYVCWCSRIVLPYSVPPDGNWILIIEQKYREFPLPSWVLTDVTVESQPFHYVLQGK